jgi:CubicO group peptidase (beta-lactamase class C family)
MPYATARSLARAAAAIILGTTLVWPLAAQSAAKDAGAYVPPPDNAKWERVEPRIAGFDAAKLDSAVRFAKASEIGMDRDMAAQLRTQTAREPYPRIDGPYKDRGTSSGIILRGGRIVAEWGDTNRIDMTFSVAKSYLATVAGLAYDRKMIPNLDDPIGKLVKDGGYDSPHNAKITWRMALTQTSEWEGVLWGKPDIADRRQGYDRKLEEPGTFYEYNDVRVNRIALSLLRVWKRPLPEVLAEYIMTPIGASQWIWYGYENSFAMVDGRRIQSVSGGGHWGGGLWASTRDHARFGLLLQRNGKWGDKQLLSERWIRESTTPSAVRPGYGFLWWLNTPSQPSYSNATPRSFFARGAGGNTIWMCPERDMVVVVRWLADTATNEFFRQILAAMGPE